MKIRGLLVALFVLCSIRLEAQKTVTTYHNDNERTGQNLQEATLNHSNVNPAQFGKLFSVQVDGYVYAQPLIANIFVAGQVRSVVIVATEHNKLYAIDANNGTIHWWVSLTPAGELPVNAKTELPGSGPGYPHGYCDNLTPDIGITGTPVIDEGTNTIYKVAVTKAGAVYKQRLWAIDLTTGAEKFGGKVEITDPTDPLPHKFSPQWELQRSALLKSGNHILIAWAGNCDHFVYDPVTHPIVRDPEDRFHGWIMSYNATSLAQEDAINLSPTGWYGGAGVWMSGGGLAADSSGNIYFATGNGNFDDNNVDPKNLGQSILKYAQASNGALSRANFFNPSGSPSAFLYVCGDYDLGSGGVVLLPGDRLVQSSKTGAIYVLDRSNMSLVQEIPGRVAKVVGGMPECEVDQNIPSQVGGMFSTPAYWNGKVYFLGAGDRLKVFSLNGAGSLSTTPTAIGPGATQGFPGSTPSISANQNLNGIVWTVQPRNADAPLNTSPAAPGAAILHAYMADNIAQELYRSDTPWLNCSDAPIGSVKFAVPTIANGKVYFGSGTQPPDGSSSSGYLNVYGPVTRSAAFLGGAIASHIDTLYGPNPEVYYVGGDQHVHQQYFNGSTWVDYDITPGAPLGCVGSGSRMSTLLDTINNRVRAFYIAADKHVHQVSYGGPNPSWVESDLLATAGGPDVAPGTGITSMLDTVNGPNVEVYYISEDHHVHQLHSPNGTSWVNEDLTALTGALAAAPGSGLTSLLDTVNGPNVEVYYVGSDQHIHQLYFGNSAWHHFDVSASVGAPASAASSRLVSLIDTIVGGNVEVYYVGADQHVHQLYFGNSAWHHFDVTASAGGSLVNALSGINTLLDTPRGNVEVYYVGLDQHIHQLYFGGGAWHHVDLMATAGGPNAAPGTDLASMVDTVNGNNIEVYYVGTDQHVRELFFNGTQWTNIVLGTSGLPDTYPPVISNVTVSGLTGSGGWVNWYTNEIADSQVQYGTSASYGLTTPLQQGLVTEHHVFLPGLQSNQDYHFRIWSRDAANNLTISLDATFHSPIDTNPPVISGINVSNFTLTGATVGWSTDEVSDTQVEYGPTTSYGSATTLNTTLMYAHAVTLSNLTANTPYHYRVKSRDGLGNLSISADQTFLFPSVLVAQFFGSGTEDRVGYLSYDPSGVPDWRIHLQGLKSTPAWVIVWNEISGALYSDPWIDENYAVLGTQYYGNGTGDLWLEPWGDNTNFHVSVWYNDGTTAETVVTPGTDQTAPTISGISSSNVTGTGATIAWTTNEVADTQVEYGLSTGYGSMTGLNSVLATTHTANLSGLSSNSPYHYRVRSRDASGNLAISGDNVFTTIDTVPPVISAIASSGLTHSGATVTWTTNEAADTQVEYGVTTGYGSSTTLNTSLVTSHTATLSGLTANTTYHYRVKSKDAAGNPATSVDKVFTTLPSPDPNPPTAPTNVVASWDDPWLGLTWNPSTDSGGSGLAGYHVYYVNYFAGIYYEYEITDPQTAYPFTELVVDTTGWDWDGFWGFRVRAVDGAGNVSTSGTWTP